MTKPGNALTIDPVVDQQKIEAEARFWEALKAHAGICVAISYSVQNETRASSWAHHPKANDEGSSAYLSARGQADVVMAMLLRSLGNIC